MKVVNLQVSAADGTAADLTLYGPVGFEFGGFTDRDVTDVLAAAGGLKTINVFLNSPGGDVFQGEAIYSQLTRHPATVNVTVDGLAASAASLIAMAGDSIVMSGAAQMMIHNPWMIALGDADDMRKAAESLDRIQNSLADVYAARTGRDRDEMLALMAQETWMTAEEAVADGFATGVEKHKTAQAMAIPDRIYAHFRHPPDNVRPAPGPDPEPDPVSEPGFFMSKSDVSKWLSEAETMLAEHRIKTAAARRRARR